MRASVPVSAPLSSCHFDAASSVCGGSSPINLALGSSQRCSGKLLPTWMRSPRSFSSVRFSSGFLAFRLRSVIQLGRSVRAGLRIAVSA